LLIQDRMFAAVNAVSGLGPFERPEFHDRIMTGRDAGQEAPQQIVGASLAIGQSAITVTGFLGTLIVLNPVMAGAVLLTVVPAIRIHLALSRQRAQATWGVSHASRRRLFYAGLLTSGDAAKEIRLFGLGTLLRGRMVKELRSVNAAERAVDLRTLQATGVLTAISATVAGTGLIWAVATARSGSLTVGDVSVFLAALAGTQVAIATMVGRFADLVEFLTLFDHYHAVVQMGPDLPVPPKPSRAQPLRRGIELRDVWFRYDESHPWILRGVDLTLPHGAATALVGLNGAGKSTIVKLLCRFYDPQRGAILWDGVDLRDISPPDLRTRISAVFQDLMRYELTVADNIGFGDLARAEDREGIAVAARLAGAHELVTALPGGYDTPLTRIFTDRGGVDANTGVLLSGGQWQRIALARALFREGRDLLILDEPGSGLDAEAEHRVHNLLRAYRTGATSLLISHRLSAVRDADSIAVIEDGRVAERGTHDALMARQGTYARLFMIQARGYEAAESTSGTVALSRRTTTPTTHRVEM
jgi:ATP-binding cassette subfamily B protein